ncbi:MAG: hypothetical protein KKA42_02345 [candidate division Zixibacteria bacterium]|nr:hypothetical protein [candidate division Zixibacteria bacterium]
MNTLKKLTIVLAAMAVLTVALGTPSVQAATFQLPAGTEVKVKFNSDLKISSGELAVGTPLAVTLAEPIKIGDRLLVAAGAAGKAVVAEVKKAGKPGKPGMIKVDFLELGTRGGFKTPDGSALKLAGSAVGKGKSKKLLAYCTIVGIFLINGGQGELDPNQTYTATIAETVVLASE